MPSELSGRDATSSTLEEALLEPENIEREAENASVFHTVYIIVSIYAGLGILALPYAVAKGGWFAETLLLGMCLLFYCSSVLMIRSFQVLETRREGLTPLYELGEILGIGRVLYTMMQLELGGNMILCSIVCLQQLEFLMSTIITHHEFHVALALFCIITGLLLLLPDLRSLRHISFVAVLATLCLVLSVAALAVGDPKRQYIPSGYGDVSYDIFNWIGVFRSVSIFSTSLSGHTALASVRKDMSSSLVHFSKSVMLSFATMGVLYVAISSCGYYYWGDQVSPIVLSDIIYHSAFSADSQSPWQWHIVQVHVLLSALVLVSSIAKLPALVMVMLDTMSSVKSNGHHRHMSYKLIITCVALFIAVVLREKVGSVIGLVGGFCSIFVSLLLPTMAYLKLSWSTSTIIQKFCLICMCSCGWIILIVATSLNIHDLTFGLV